MKTKQTLTVGVKIGTEHFSVECLISTPDTLADCKVLAKDSDAFIAQMFERGWRIWNQEQTGARDIVREATVTERKDVPALTAKVQATIDAADPLTPPKRTGRPAKPAEAKMTPEIQKLMAKGDTAGLAAELAKQGIKISFSK